jgi:hypothetical protein
VTDVDGVAQASLTPESSSTTVAKQLQKMLGYLASSGTRVWLVKQVPETSDFETARHYYLSERFPHFNHSERFTTTLAQHLERQQWANAAVASLRSPHLTIVDPAPPFFENPKGRLEEYSERSHYRDNHHLTQYGADKFLFEQFDRIFAEMTDPPPGERPARD